MEIRPYRTADAEAVVDLSLRAWAPVFASFRQVMGAAIFARLYPDWRTTQREAVLQSCTAPGMEARVAEWDSTIAGFITWRLDHERLAGEVDMLAVDPDFQRKGIATALNATALDAMRAGGMLLAEVGTGGDPGHAPARVAYERAGYTAMPLVRYYQVLAPDAGTD